MNIPLLYKLTLIIPTFNRQAFALRNMTYWSGRGTVIHVLDGSESPISADDLKVLGGNIHYHHLPVGVVDRLKIALSLVNTEYVAFLSDDEFFIPNALSECIRVMESEHDMVSCGGRCMMFWRAPCGIMGAPAYTTQQDYAVLMSDPVERMVYHMSPYTPSTFYSVVRADVWKKAMGILVQKEFPVYAIGELQFELAICYQGMSRVLPHLMWLRSDENPQLTGTSISLEPANPIWNWWFNSNTLNQRNEFMDIMSNGLASSSSDVSVLRDGVSSAIDTYVNEYRNSQNILNKVLSVVKKSIPFEIKQAIKKVIRPNQGAALRIGPALLMDVAQAMAASGVSVDFQELANIERVVTDFHKNRVLN
jgi:glycosyltransferase domain-containing protein